MEHNLTGSKHATTLTGCRDNRDDMSPKRPCEDCKWNGCGADCREYETWLRLRGKIS